ncbi:putative Mg2+ transporter-C (MgtC) family protein [Seinonella peptonophila]|uniref:Putative Mg2+ transporter-C (MgtC) family protein n=1 Tax=Seinonella peptonophila TaxID=112248 RepID=A0A1M4YTG2_9BACL|nr:MgtC/SapB family protein [Seinonella peptonophila]SHF09023.1 putative Mg2+ transporter-C (MgtC) family protein [Seinonella peptonophila]
MVSLLWNVPYFEITLRLFLAALLAGLIGWERERDNHPAGFRTHILVCVGSALIMLISVYGFGEFMNSPNVRFDPSRIGAQVVSGIGFLGAGTIIRQGVTVSGLTTAASLWVVAGIGLAVGAGFMFGAVLATALVLVSLEVLNRVDQWALRKNRLRVFTMEIEDQRGKLSELANAFVDLGGSVQKIDIKQYGVAKPNVKIQFTVMMNEEVKVEDLCDEIRTIDGVQSIQTE